jgi:uncharacterized protein
MYARFWDNRRSKFFDEDGKLIKIEVEVTKPEDGRGAYPNCCDPNTPEEVGKRFSEKALDHITSTKKSKDAVSLRIQMGMRCNFSCAYCKQATHKKYDPKADYSDAIAFVKNFGNICTTDRREPINIQLWGGEPLLYWDTLTLLGKFFRTEFPNSRITVLSNGSLLTKAKADWFINNNIILAFSHDGPDNNAYRTKDPLAEGSSSLKWLRYYAEKCKEPLYVNAVITKGRYDLPGIMKYISERVGKNVRVGFEGIVLVEDENQFDASSMFTDEDYMELRRTIVEQLIAGELNDLDMFKLKVNSILSSVVAERSFLPDNIQQKCSMDSPYNLSVNLKGDILACHSTPKKIGHVDNFEEASLDKIGFTHWSKRKECLECPVLTLCRGGCLAQDATAFYHSCNNEFHFNMIFFEVVYRLIFGEKILAIEGLYRPTKENFLTR